MPRRESVNADATLPAVLGTVGWLIALIVLATGDRITADRAWWISTCLFGVTLGLFGTGFALRRRAAYLSATDAQRRTAAADQSATDQI
jgi:hypothetical protein